MPAPSHAYTDTNPQKSPLPLYTIGLLVSSLPSQQPGRPSWRHPVWQDRPADKGGGAWPLRCHVLGLRAAPTFGPKDKSDERASRRGVLRRLPVCYCYASYRYYYQRSFLLSLLLGQTERERESSVVRIQKVGVTKQRNVAFNKKKKKKGKEMQSFVSND